MPLHLWWEQSIKHGILDRRKSDIFARRARHVIMWCDIISTYYVEFCPFVWRPHLLCNFLVPIYCFWKKRLLSTLKWFAIRNMHVTWPKREGMVAKRERREWKAERNTQSLVSYVAAPANTEISVVLFQFVALFLEVTNDLHRKYKYQHHPCRRLCSENTFSELYPSALPLLYKYLADSVQTYPASMHFFRAKCSHWILTFSALLITYFLRGKKISALNFKNYCRSQKSSKLTCNGSKYASIIQDWPDISTCVSVRCVQ